MKDNKRLPVPGDTSEITVENAPTPEPAAQEIDVAAIADRNVKLAQELAATKARFQQYREERCLDDIQELLRKHQCALRALPNGNFEVKYLGD